MFSCRVGKIKDRTGKSATGKTCALLPPGAAGSEGGTGDPLPFRGAGRPSRGRAAGTRRRSGSAPAPAAVPGGSGAPPAAEGGGQWGETAAPRPGGEEGRRDGRRWLGEGGMEG